MRQRTTREALLIPAIVTAALFASATGASGQEQWRGLTLAPEHRCAPYDSDDYRYSQRLEPLILERLGGLIYSPYTGERFRSLRETDIEHIVARRTRPRPAP